MKQEVRRGRKFVEYHDPDTQDEHTFTQVIGAHDVSYQETVGGSWLPVNESWETDGQDGFSFRAHRMNHKVRFDSIGAWRWYPRRNVETEYIVIKRPQCWLTATKRWGNLLVNGISREGRDITLTSVRKVTRVIHSRWNGIKTDWILLDSTAPTKFRQQIDLVGLTELDGWLYGADGEKVALLTPTTAIGADGAELPCSGSYVDGYLQFEADVTGAVYPVVIDPDFAINAGVGGDNWLKPSSPTFNSGVYIYYNGRALMRFDLSSISSGSICNSATLSLKPAESASAKTTNLYKITDANGDWIEGTKTLSTAGAGEPCWNAKEADGSGGVTTAWAGSAGLSTAGTDYVNTVLATYTGDYTAGTYLDVSFNNDGLTVLEDWFGDATNNGFLIIDNSGRYMRTKDNEAKYRPVLTVTYTAATTGTLRRTNMNAQMSSLTGGMHG